MSDDFINADLYDEHGDQCVSCATQFRQFGARRTFAGRIRTVRCVNDNVLLRQTLEQSAEGDVLVVDAGGYLGAAVMGDMIAEIALRSGWAGVIIHGAIRDSKAIARLELGVKALGTNPRKSQKHGDGEVDVPVAFGGVTFVPGHYLYSDDDGILVSATALR